MFKLILASLTVFCLVALGGAPAMAGGCLAKDPVFTQCTESPAGTDEGMIKSQCKAFNQEYVTQCVPPEHKYCVSGDKQTGRVFTWGKDVDKDICANGTWHP